MRLSALILLTAAAASPASAQTFFDGLHAENRLAAQQEAVRQRALAADREALVLQSRARTAASLQVLRDQRLTAAAATAGEPATLPPLDPRIAAEMETMARLQAKALAESNARILAIKPASED